MITSEAIKQAINALNSAEVETQGQVLYITDRTHFAMVMSDKANNFRTKHYKHRHFKKIIKKVWRVDDGWIYFDNYMHNYRILLLHE